MSLYKYTVFDGNPNDCSGGTAWPSHEGLEIEADSDEEALAEVRDVLRAEASGLHTSDLYEPGDTIIANVWDADGAIVGQPQYELTHEDLGLETPEERLERAVKHLDAVPLDSETWAYRADETRRWYKVSSDDLETLSDYLEHRCADVRLDAYSHWCAATSVEEMPEGWTP